MSAATPRFQRTAYSRRAALLAEDLDEWNSIYLTQRFGDRSFMYTDRQLADIEQRCDVLHDLAGRLREISMQLAALR